MQIEYERRFLRQLRALPKILQNEIFIAVDKLKDETNHKSIGVHKLQGKLRDAYSASVNYKIRMIFFYPKGKPRRITLIAVGDHEIYE